MLNGSGSVQLVTDRRYWKVKPTHFRPLLSSPSRGLVWKDKIKHFLCPLLPAVKKTTFQHSKVRVIYFSALTEGIPSTNSTAWKPIFNFRQPNSRARTLQRRIETLYLENRKWAVVQHKTIFFPPPSGFNFLGPSCLMTGPILLPRLFLRTTAPFVENGGLFRVGGELREQ